jgi:transcriptional regulator with XRE-family HTH domain
MRKQLKMATDTSIIEALKAARTRKGLSQRALSQLVGMPQSHISKIEAGGVDLQLSSLTELARVLELELRLVPRRAVPAVDSVVRSVAPSSQDEAQSRITDDLRRLAERLSAFDGDPRIQESLRNALHLLQRVSIPAADLPVALNAVQTLLHAAEAGEITDPQTLRVARRATDVLRDMRNRMAHAAPAPTIGPRPAYQLDEEDDNA